MITLDVWLYGPLARYSGKGKNESYVNLKVKVPVGSRLCDLLNYLNLPSDQRGITLINGKLTALPGLQPDVDLILNDGDRVALFHLKSMWPFQYRDGSELSSEMKKALLKNNKLFHHRKKTSS
jgi:hypothetical protein